MPQRLWDEVEVAGDGLKAAGFPLIDSREVTQGIPSEIHDLGRRFLSSRERPFVHNRTLSE
jgi:hypothetical protein